MKNTEAVDFVEEKEYCVDFDIMGNIFHGSFSILFHFENFFMLKRKLKFFTHILLHKFVTIIKERKLLEVNSKKCIYKNVL